MNIVSCIQRCLQSPLGQRQYPNNFDFPTWTEEQRMVLAFWRVIFYNELTKEAIKGSLPWPAEDIERLFSENRRRFRDGPIKSWQPLTALLYIEDIASAGKSSKEVEGDLKSFQVPPLPKEAEFACKCQPAPSWRAITQGWELGEKPRGRPWWLEHDVDPEPLRGVVRYFGSSDSDSSSESGYGFGDDYLPEEEESSSASDSSSNNSERIRGAGCILYDPYIQDFGPTSTGVNESWDLEMEPLGQQFWREMIEDPDAGPAMNISFMEYVRYGFAIWEEQRMVDLGLWSKDYIEMSVYYRKWYQFLETEENS
ncbi:hypothetical protein PITC_049760 [Penicillium italicum]|uniref:Uncharacterized protein n=1 Tax=Penicillium italicum TaxID=40296 RepID=A0A0A2K6X8_PENIT|nr:hypothetical protein PITC_049760 [Penicillium italicum]